MLIVETPVFTKRVLDILTDDEYRELQYFLAQYPDAGDIIPGSHGLRKLRWTISGKGKRGGTRIIYYWLRPRDTILMLFVFKKNERSDLTKDQLKTLRSIAAKELR
jgi:mRNA-degrading endonuclease RelE of RelBE toxin-antitoxin system